MILLKIHQKMQIKGVNMYFVFKSLSMLWDHLKITLQNKNAYRVKTNVIITQSSLFIAINQY